MDHDDVSCSGAGRLASLGADKRDQQFGLTEGRRQAESFGIHRPRTTGLGTGNMAVLSKFTNAEFELQPTKVLGDIATGAERNYGAS